MSPISESESSIQESRRLEARYPSRRVPRRRRDRVHSGSRGENDRHERGRGRRGGCAGKYLRGGSRAKAPDEIHQKLTRREVRPRRRRCTHRVATHPILAARSRTDVGRQSRVGARPRGFNYALPPNACCLNRRQGAADLSRRVRACLRGAQSVRQLPKFPCCLRTCRAEARVLPQLRSSLTRG